MLNVGSMYLRGEGSTKDLNQAKYWYKKACEAGETFGCDTLKELN